MAHFHVKKKNGRPYLYVREIARVDGKPKVVSQVYIGSPDKVASLARGEGYSEDIRLKVEEFGALWLCDQIDKDISLAGIVDGVIVPGSREKGPSVGEYFLYCVFNRMIEAVSKNALSNWYSRTAVQQIRPVDIGELSSARYWEKWERVSEDDLEKISRKFFERVWRRRSPVADCLLFDTTNYYTFMASDTPSKLAVRGKNKEGRHNLRQVGLGLLVERDSHLPLYYRAYPGNMHDSRLFESLMDEMFGIVTGLSSTKERLTVVIDKGMNSEGNYTRIDEHSRIHFITTYSTYFSSELTSVPLSRFEPVDTEKNQKLLLDGDEYERIIAYRTKGEYWGKDRSVVVTYNPATARKQEYVLEEKLAVLRDLLLEMRANVRDEAPHWRNPEKVKERYLRECERLHVSSDLFEIEFEQKDGRGFMSFRKNSYALEKKKNSFGKNIIITDNTDWTTSQIVQASLERWRVEDAFRLSKDEDLVGVQPLRHWTDSKIRCHLFTCVVAMTYLRMIEQRLADAGVKRTAVDVMDDMKHLHSVLTLTGNTRKPLRRLETATKTQAEVLRAFGHHVDKSGVLQPLPQ